MKPKENCKRIKMITEDFTLVTTIRDVVKHYNINKEYSEEFLNRKITKETIDDIRAIHNLSVQDVLECLSQFNINSDIIVKAVKINDKVYWCFVDLTDKKFKPLIEHIWVGWIYYDSSEDISKWFNDTIGRWGAQNFQGRSDFTKNSHMD